MVRGLEGSSSSSEAETGRAVRGARAREGATRSREMRTTRATWHPHGAAVVRVERGAWSGGCQWTVELVQHKAELVGGAGEGSRWFVVVWPKADLRASPALSSSRPPEPHPAQQPPPIASTPPQSSTPTPPRPLESTRSSPPRRPPPSMASLLAHDYQSLAKEAGRRHSDVRDVRPPLPPHLFPLEAPSPPSLDPGSPSSRSLALAGSRQGPPAHQGGQRRRPRRTESRCAHPSPSQTTPSPRSPR